LIIKILVPLLILSFIMPNSLAMLGAFESAAMSTIGAYSELCIRHTCCTTKWCNFKAKFGLSTEETFYVCSLEDTYKLDECFARTKSYSCADDTTRQCFRNCEGFNLTYYNLVYGGFRKPQCA
jgi:hypothetical protein